MEGSYPILIVSARGGRSPFFSFDTLFYTYNMNTLTKAALYDEVQQELEQTKADIAEFLACIPTPTNPEHMWEHMVSDMKAKYPKPKFEAPVVDAPFVTPASAEAIANEIETPGKPSIYDRFGYKNATHEENKEVGQSTII